MVEKQHYDEAIDYILKMKEKEVKPMPEGSIYCPTCHQPHSAHTELVEARTLLRERDKKLEEQASKALEQLEAISKGHTSPTPELFGNWETCPDCKPKLEKLMNEKYVIPAVERGRQSIGKDEVEKWLKENHYLPAIREILVSKGGKK